MNAFTRAAGVAGLLGACTLIASALWEPISRAMGFSLAAGGSFAEVATAGAALVAVGLSGTYARVRRALPPWARLGLPVGVGAAELAVFSALVWLPGPTLWAALAIAGILVHLGAAMKTGLVPRGPMWLLIVSVVIGMQSYMAEGSMMWLAWTAMIATLVAFAWLLPVLWRPSPDARTGPDGAATPSLRTPR